MQTPRVFKDLALPVGGAPDKPELKRTLSFVDLAAFRGETVNHLFAPALAHRLAHSPEEFQERQQKKKPAA